jgi:hypothetical protein
VIGYVSSLFNISAANTALSAQILLDGSFSVYDNTSNEFRFRDLGSFPWTYGNVTPNISILGAGNY